MGLHIFFFSSFSEPSVFHCGHLSSISVFLLFEFPTNYICCNSAEMLLSDCFVDFVDFNDTFLLRICNFSPIFCSLFVMLFSLSTDGNL